MLSKNKYSDPYICLVYSKFIDICTEHHIGCLYAKYVERFTDSYTSIVKLILINIYGALHWLRYLKYVQKFT